MWENPPDGFASDERGKRPPLLKDLQLGEAVSKNMEIKMYKKRNGL